MSRFDAVVCDIDGCLGPESDEPLDIHRLVRVADHNRARRGPVVTVCSGRPLPFAEAVCRLIANDRIPAVCENGVWLYDPCNRRFERDPRIAQEHLDAVASLERYVELELHPVVIQPGKTASVSLWHQSVDHLRTLCPVLEARFAREGWPFRVSMTVAWINCDLAFISKATGVQRLLDRTGLTRERLVGIGDAPSDLLFKPMVGLFAAPANAHPQVAAQADYLSPHHEVEGVLDILARVSA